MTYVIHGATGAQGAPLFDRLTRAGHKTVAAVRDTAKAGGLPAVSVDYASVDSLAAAYEDAEGVFVHLPLGDERDRARFAQNIAEAIGRARPRRVVISTSGNVVDEPGAPQQVAADNPIAILIREVERTDVSHAVVAPRFYLENLLLPFQFAPVAREGVLRYPLPPDYPASWGSHRDVAEVVERLFADTGIGGVVGVGHLPGLTGRDLAAGFSAHLGREIRYEGLTPAAFGELLTPVFGAGAAAGVEAGYRAFNAADDNVIVTATSAQQRLGLEPRTLTQWLAEVELPE